ncbi:MAG: hypothetical protein AAFX65_03855 [Cyanobacteria bacterium J06638_7]
MSVTELLAKLEVISRTRPDRVLRLRGTVPAAGEGREPFELLIFRGFSSSVSHPTAFDPDQPALPEQALIEAAELLGGPLDPTAEQRLAGPLPAHTFLEPEAWR